MAAEIDVTLRGDEARVSISLDGEDDALTQGPRIDCLAVFERLARQLIHETSPRAE